MVRAIKVIGAIFSVFAGSSSAFAPQHNGISQMRISQSSTNAMRNIPSTGLFASRDTLTMMSSVLERPTIKIGGPAVLDRPAVEKKKSKDPVKEEKRTGSEAWEVRIYNDSSNTREFVARCLVQITGLSEITAYQTMMQAHQNGLAVVGRYAYEIAEMYYSALKKNGIICDLVPVEEEK